MNIEDEIKIVAEKMRDNEWWRKNEAGIKRLFEDKNNSLALKKHLVSDKNFNIVEIVKRLNIFVEEDFIVDSLKIRSNINQHMYYSLYSLYQKKLISSKCLEKIKKKFLVMRNAELLFSDIENRFMISKIEKDRYHFRKVREESIKVSDYEEEIIGYMKSTRSLDIKNPQIFSCMCHVDDVIILFNMDVLFSLNIRIPDISDLLNDLHKPISFLQHNTFYLKSGISYSMLEFNYRNNFPIESSASIPDVLGKLYFAGKTYSNTNFSRFKRPNTLLYFDKFFKIGFQ